MDERSDISSLASNCRDRLDGISQSSDHVGDTRKWAGQEARRLKLFTDALGVFAKGQLSIRYRLRLNPTTHYAIAQLLEAVIQNTSIQGADADDPRPSLERAYVSNVTFQASSHERFALPSIEITRDLARERVTDDIGTLIALSALIRSRSNVQHAAQGNETGPSYDSGGPQELENDSLKGLKESLHYILDREFGPAQSQIKPNAVLRQRFEETVLERRRRILRWNARADKFQEGAVTASTGSWPVHTPLEGSTSKAATTNENLGEATSKSESKHVVSDKATTLTPSFKPHQAARTVRVTVSGDDGLEIPQPKNVVRSGDLAEFICPVCRRVQQYPSAKHAFDRNWKHHYLQDFRPYICLIQDCKSRYLQYSSLDEWRAHTDAAHAEQVWACRQCDAAPFSSKGGLLDHLDSTHGAQLSEQEKNFVGSISSHKRYEFESCHVCGSEVGRTEMSGERAGIHLDLQERLVRCMGKHMYDIAQHSMPDGLDFAEETSGAGTSHNLEGLEDLEANFETYVAGEEFQSVLGEEPASDRIEDSDSINAWRERVETELGQDEGGPASSLLVKQVRANPAKDLSRSLSGFNTSKDPARDYTPGRIVEVALHPPSTSPGERVRYRRFVIIRQRPDGRSSFEALAIKTYMGRGVAAPGVIKSHHSIIYTTPQPPTPRPEELSHRTATGELEMPMQPIPIRVIPVDRTLALDPMARLDYTDAYEFDFGVSNIRIFGRIHQDSVPAFYVAYNSIWAQLMGPTHRPRDASAAASRPRERLQSKIVDTRVSATEPILLSVEQMTAVLHRYQRYAKSHNLPVPNDLTPAHTEQLAKNADARIVYLQRIKDKWNEVEEGDSEDESDEEVDVVSAPLTRSDSSQGVDYPRTNEK